MITDFAEATDQINKLFNDAWQVGTSSIVGYIPEIRWEGKEKDPKPDASKFWVRHSVQSVDENQSSLSVCEGVSGNKKYTSTGLVFIQVFCPKSIINANAVGKKLAAVGKKAYRGKTTQGKIWFRNVRVVSIPEEFAYYRFNVIAEYEYDEIG